MKAQSTIHPNGVIQSSPNDTMILNTKIDLHHIIVVKNGLITRVGGVVSGAVVEGNTTRETATSLIRLNTESSKNRYVRTFFSNKKTNTVFNGVAQVPQLDAWLDDALSIGTNLVKEPMTIQSVENILDDGPQHPFSGRAICPHRSHLWSSPPH